MPRLGVFVLSNYFAVIYVPVYSMNSDLAIARDELGDLCLGPNSFFGLV